MIDAGKGELRKAIRLAGQFSHLYISDSFRDPTGESGRVAVWDIFGAGV